MMNKQLQPINLLDFKQFLINWNILYPYDRVWRLKYNIPFGSEQHRNMHFQDMVMDLLEGKIMRELEEEQFADSMSDFFNAELPEETDQLKNQGKQVIKKMTQSQLDKDFDNLDISQFNDVDIK